MQDLKDAIDYFRVGAQNWVLADTEGTTAYKPYAHVPVRPKGFDYSLPVTGDGSADWVIENGATKWLSAEQLPHANDPEPWLATANTDLQGNLQDNDPFNDTHYLYWDRAPGHRLERIHDLLGAKPKHTLEDMSTYQYDFYVKEAEVNLEAMTALVEASDLSSEAASALSKLKAWQNDDVTPLNAHAGVDAASLRDDMGIAPAISDNDQADAVATTIFYAWFSRLLDAVYADEFTTTTIDPPYSRALPRSLHHLLNHAEATAKDTVIATTRAGVSTLWDNRSTGITETPQAIVTEALNGAVEDMATRFGSSDQSTWLWGEIHILNLTHNLDLAGAEKYNIGYQNNIPMHGARNTVSPAHFSAHGPLVEPEEYLVTTAGPSKRFVIEMDPEGVRAFNIVPGGTIGSLEDADDYDNINDSINYSQWVDEWLHGEVFQYRHTAEDVAEYAVAVWDLQ